MAKSVSMKSLKSKGYLKPTADLSGAPVSDAQVMARSCKTVRNAIRATGKK